MLCKAPDGKGPPPSSLASGPNRSSAAVNAQSPVRVPNPSLADAQGPSELCPPAASLVAELDIPRTRGRPAAELLVSTVRPLTAEDLPALRPPAAPSSGEPWRLKQIRHVHHQIARLVALGHSDVEVGLITGYTPVHVRNLKDDPQFTDLVAYYAVQVDAVMVEATERLKVVGLTAVEEIQQRLDDAPNKWANRELMELAEMALVKPGKAGSMPGMAGGGASVAINVKFVSSSSEAPTVDITPGEAE